MPTLSIVGGSSVETFNNFIRFNVTLSEPSVDMIMVEFRTLRDTASDFDLDNALTGSANNGTLTFAPGETSREILIEAESDTLDERDESLFVRLSNPQNAVLADGANQLDGVGFILDDDGLGPNRAVAAADAQPVETAGGTQRGHVVVAPSRPGTAPITFDVSATPVTADANDFLLTQSVTFAPGQTTAAIAVEIEGDVSQQRDETFSIELVPDCRTSARASWLRRISPVSRSRATRRSSRPAPSPSPMRRGRSRRVGSSRTRWRWPGWPPRTGPIR
jgi:hypothetical protein